MSEQTTYGYVVMNQLESYSQCLAEPQACIGAAVIGGYILQSVLGGGLDRLGVIERLVEESTHYVPFAP